MRRSFCRQLIPAKEEEEPRCVRRPGAAGSLPGEAGSPTSPQICDLQQVLKTEGDPIFGDTGSNPTRFQSKPRRSVLSVPGETLELEKDKKKQQDNL